MKATALYILAISAALLSAEPALADVIVATPPDPGTGNSFPFGSAYNAEYQQLYASSAFSGPLTITGLEFFNTQFNSGATSTPSGNYTISLSTDPASLVSPFSSNTGADNTVVFNGSLSQSWAFGDTLNIFLSTPFTYNPSNGNLLLDVVGSGISTPANIYFDVNSTAGELSRDYCPSGIACVDGTVESNYGLVTGFTTTATAVPEPLSLSIFGAGLAGVAVVRRRRKTAKQQ